MPKLLTALAATGLALLNVSASHPSAAKESRTSDRTEERIKREAIALFQVILQENAQNPTRCQFQAKWMEYPIPHFVARQHLGLTIHADLTPSLYTAAPKDTLDPQGTMRDAFCSPEEEEKWHASLVDNLKAKEISAKNTTSVFRPRTEAFRQEFTFPVFDKEFRRAVIITGGTERSWTKEPDGEILKGLHLMGGASIYEKRKGHWRILKHINLFHGSG